MRLLERIGTARFEVIVTAMIAQSEAGLRARLRELAQVGGDPGRSGEVARRGRLHPRRPGNDQRRRGCTHHRPLRQPEKRGSIMAISIEPPRSALLIYDMWDEPAVPSVERGIADHRRLLDRCREAGVFVAYAMPPAGQRTVAPTLAPRAAEPIFEHAQSGASGDTGFAERLRAEGRDALWITGMAVDRGCNTTARQALALGLTPVLVRGLLYTRDIEQSPVGPAGWEEIERIHLASLRRMGCSIVPVADLLAAL
jgi:isochorismate hydrolase